VKDEKKDRVLNLILNIRDGLKSLGLKGYIVGGYPRDLFLKREAKDIDVLVFGDNGAKRLAEILHKAYGFSRPVDFSKGKDKKFERYLLFKDETEIEIIPPRGKLLKDDLIHRDFTVNTLVIPLTSHYTGSILDPLRTSQIDIRSRVLRTPLSPEKAIKEDPLRIVRAARFIGELGFNVEREFVRSASSLSYLLKEMPGERIGEEITKLLLSEKPSRGLFFLRDIGCFNIIAKEITPALYFEQKTPYHIEDLFSHQLSVVDYIKPELSLRLAAFFHDTGKAYEEKEVDGRVVYYGHEKKSREIAARILKRWCIPKEKRRRALFLIENHMVNYSPEWTDSAIRRLIYKAGENLDYLIEHLKADVRSTMGSKDYRARYKNVLQLEKRVKKMLINMHSKKITSPLDGYDIQRILGIPPSQIVGKVKDFLIKSVIEGKIKQDDKTRAEVLIREEFSKLIKEMKNEDNIL